MISNTIPRSEAIANHSLRSQAFVHQERDFNVGSVQHHQDKDMKAECFERTINDVFSTTLCIKGTF